MLSNSSVPHCRNGIGIGTGIDTGIYTLESALTLTLALAPAMALVIALAMALPLALAMSLPLALAMALALKRNVGGVSDSSEAKAHKNSTTHQQSPTTISQNIEQELENRRDVINTEVDMFATSEGRRMITQKEQVQSVLQQMTTFCDTTVRSTTKTSTTTNKNNNNSKDITTS